MARAVEFEALGKRWSLRMTINALCQIEAATKSDFKAVVERLKEGSFQTTRAVFGAALGGKTPEEKVGEIIDDIGFQQAVDLLGQAITQAFPEAGAGAEMEPGN